eukprot:1048259-Rhodomonas_salina.1
MCGCEGALQNLRQCPQVRRRKRTNQQRLTGPPSAHTSVLLVSEAPHKISKSRTRREHVAAKTAQQQSHMTTQAIPQSSETHSLQRNRPRRLGQDHSRAHQRDRCARNNNCRSSPPIPRFSHRPWHCGGESGSEGCPGGAPQGDGALCPHREGKLTLRSVSYKYCKIQ